MASVPYKDERGPLTISMRSSDSGAMFCSAAPPMVPGLMRTPSMSTTVWLLSVPRVNREVVWPGPPLRAISRPACCCSSSLTSLASERSMSLRVITMTGAPTESSGTGVRVAVMMVSSSSSCANATGQAESGRDGERQLRRTNCGSLIQAFPCTPAWQLR